MTKPNLLFPTPVWTINLDNYNKINEQMYSYIKSNQTNDEIGISKSNVKGWHSKDFNLSEKDPQNFITFILPAIEKVRMTWAGIKKSKQLKSVICGQ